MTIHATRIASFVLIAALVAGPGPALAQTQSVSQQKCITSVAKAASILAKTFRKQAEGCIKSSTTGQAALSCITSDSRNRIANAASKIGGAVLKSCDPAPSFGVSSAEAVIAATLAGERDLATDMFGESFLSSSLPTGADDRSCRTAIAKSYGMLADTVAKYFQRCVKAGLKTGQIDSAVDMAACMNGLTGDGDGARAVSSAVDKLMLQALSKCDISSVVDLFPGYCGDTAGILDFGACVGTLVKCRSCLGLNDTASLARDCDTMDDGSANGTCPPVTGPTTTSTTSTTTTSTTTSTTSTTLPPTTTTTVDTTTTTLDTTTTTLDTTTTTTTTTLPTIETHVFDMACASAVLNVPLLGGPQALKGIASVTIVVDLTTIGDRNGNGKEDVDIEITDLFFRVDDPETGDFTEVRERAPGGHPAIDQRSYGYFEESVNSTPGVLDIPPHAGSGSGIVHVEAFVEAQVKFGTSVNTTLHHDVPLILEGTISADPPLVGDVMNMVNASPIPILNPADFDFFGTTLDEFSIEVNASTCE